MSSCPPEQLAQYLEVMGIQRWVRRSLTPAPPPVPTPAAEAVPVTPPSTTSSPPSSPTVPPPADEAPPWLDATPPAWVDSESLAPPLEAPPPDWESPTLADTIAPLSWTALHEYALQCQACSLAQTRQRVLFGEGDAQARWLLISDMPNADEDVQGRLFPTGSLGQLFDALLSALGMQRQQIFLTTAVKCHPPKGRDPHRVEKQMCAAYLARQIALIQPQLILTLGGLASQQVLNVETPISELRGQVYHYGPQQIPVIPTFHPNYLLHRPIEKRKVWQDLQRALQYQG